MTHDQFNISGFPKLLRLKLAHLAIDNEKKLNRHIIHVLWESVKFGEMLDRLRKLNMSLNPEPDNQWSVSDCRVSFFGKTAEEAIGKAEKKEDK